MSAPVFPRGLAHLVGSVPLASAEDVFRTVTGALGDCLSRVPDGETGARRRWIWWQREMLERHPAMEVDREAGLPQIWLIPRSGPIRHITHDLSQYAGLSLSRDGKKILTSQVGRISELWVVDRNDPAAARMVSEPGRRFDTPAWPP